MPTPEPLLPGISVRAAADRLSTSPSTIRRMVREGQLRGEYFDRPGGTLLRVFLDDADPAPPDAAHSEQAPAPEPHQGAPGALQAAVESLTDALADERAERQRATVENATLRERAIRAETLLEASAQTIEALSAARDAEAKRADDLAARLKRAEDERDAERAKSWWQKLLGRG